MVAQTDSATLARSALGTLALQASYVVLSFTTVIVLAHVLGVAGFGVYAYALAWTTLLGVPAVLGLDRLIVRDLAIYVATDRWGLIGGLLRRSNQMVLVAATSVGVCAGAVGLVVLDAPEAYALAVAVVLVPLTALTLLRQASLQGLGRPVLGVLPELLIRPLGMTAVFGAIWFLVPTRVGPVSAMAISLAITALAFLVGVVLLRTNIPAVVKDATRAYETRRWVAAAAPMMMLGAVWVVNGYVGTIMLGSLVDSRSAGIYTVASRGADFVALILLAVNVPLAPRMARLHAEGNNRDLQRLVTAVARWTLLASLPLGVALFLARDAYLSLFGAGFASGDTAMAILVFGQLMNVAAGPVGMLLLMTGCERWAALGVACGAMLNVAVNAVLDPIIGLSGAAIGALVSVLCWNLFMAVVAARNLGIRTTVVGARRGH